MSMTRSDFIALSCALAASRPREAQYRSAENYQTAGRVWGDTARRVCLAIAAKTPAGVFDQSRFLADCGLRAGG